MAINNRAIHVYDAEYVPAALPRVINLFARSAATQVNYVDAAAATVSRQKGFEDTNLTEDGCIREANLEMMHLGIRLTPGDDPTSINHLKDIYAFFERGFVNIITNDNTIEATYRLKDLMANGTFEVSGGSTVAATTAFSGSHKGRMVELGGIRVPKAVRFRVEINFDRQVTLPSGKAARIEAEINGRSSRPAMAAPKPVTGVVMAR